LTALSVCQSVEYLLVTAIDESGRHHDWIDKFMQKYDIE